jgi:hypothetical protein
MSIRLDWQSQAREFPCSSHVACQKAYRLEAAEPGPARYTKRKRLVSCGKLRELYGAKKTVWPQSQSRSLWPQSLPITTRPVKGR